MPPYKEPHSLEQMSCQVLLAILYHLTIKHDHDVTQSGKKGVDDVIPYKNE